jgi:hypothetical protein
MDQQKAQKTLAGNRRYGNRRRDSLDFPGGTSPLILKS